MTGKKIMEKEFKLKKRKITFEKIEKVSNCRNELAEKLEKLNSLISFESEYKEKLGIAQAKKQQYMANIDISLGEFEQYYEKQKQIVLSYDEKQELYQKVKTNLMLKEKELAIELKNNNKNREQLKKKKGIFDYSITYVVLALFIIASVFFIYRLTISNKATNTVKVPAVIGLDKDEAIKVLKEKKLIVSDGDVEAYKKVVKSKYK